MKMFDVSDNEMINLDMIEYVKFGKSDEKRSIIVGVGSRSFVIPSKKHKEFFQILVYMGINPTKQFVSV